MLTPLRISVAITLSLMGLLSQESTPPPESRPTAESPPSAQSELHADRGRSQPATGFLYKTIEVGNEPHAYCV